MLRLKIRIIEVIYDFWWCCRSTKGMWLRGLGLAWAVCRILTGISIAFGWLAYKFEVLDNRLRVKSVLVLDTRHEIDDAEQRRLLGLRKDYRKALLDKADKQASQISATELALTNRRQQSLDYHRTEAEAEKAVT